MLAVVLFLLAITVIMTLTPAVTITALQIQLFEE
jgi:hypothetical protein